MKRCMVCSPVLPFRPIKPSSIRFARRSDKEIGRTAGRLAMSGPRMPLIFRHRSYDKQYGRAVASPCTLPSRSAKEAHVAKKANSTKKRVERSSQNKYYRQQVRDVHTLGAMFKTSSPYLIPGHDRPAHPISSSTSNQKQNEDNSRTLKSPSSYTDA